MKIIGELRETLPGRIFLCGTMFGGFDAIAVALVSDGRYGLACACVVAASIMWCVAAVVARTESRP